MKLVAYLTNSVTVTSLPEVEVKNDAGNPLPVSGSVSVANFPGSQTVNGTIAVSNPTNNPETGLAKDLTVGRRYATGRIPYSARLTASAQVVPTSGKTIRVVWVSVLPSADNTAGNKVVVKFHSAAKALYTGEVIGHWESFEGTLNDPVDITLTNAQAVDVNINYEEF